MGVLLGIGHSNLTADALVIRHQAISKPKGLSSSNLLEITIQLKRSGHKIFKESNFDKTYPVVKGLNAVVIYFIIHLFLYSFLLCVIVVAVTCFHIITSV